ncbi:MAG TPA: hypothetical protein VMN39_10530, partial [Longimicrobiaceae bacterium]|nr:hypothetical protein [Longimicrobiaceae bacterium]
AAVTEAESAVTLSPVRLENYHLLAELRIRGRQPEAALATLERARAVHPDYVATEQLTASAELQRGRPEAGFEAALRSLDAAGAPPSVGFVESVASSLRNRDRPDLAAGLREAYLRRRYLAGNTAADRTGPSELAVHDWPLAARLPLDYLRIGDREGALRSAKFLASHVPGAARNANGFVRAVSSGDDEMWRRLDRIPIDPR